MYTDKTIRLAGILIAAGMFAGILSVAPAVDSAAYLTEAAREAPQVFGAAVFQLAMSCCYVGVAILLYPLISRHHKTLAIGFLSLRMIAVGLSLIGTLLLLSIVALSETFTTQDPATMESLGYVLKLTRDAVNHVFMVLMLCLGNIALYVLLLKSKLLPVWLLAWGITGALLSILASMLVMLRVMDVITPAYLILNAPTGIFEIILSLWWMTKGMPITRDIPGRNRMAP